MRGDLTGWETGKLAGLEPWIMLLLSPSALKQHEAAWYWSVPAEASHCSQKVRDIMSLDSISSQREKS